MLDPVVITLIGTTISGIIAFIIKLKIRHIRLCFGLVEIDRQPSLVVQNTPEEMKEEPIPIRRKSNSNLHEPPPDTPKPKNNVSFNIETQRKRNSTARAEDIPIYSKTDYLNEKKKAYNRLIQNEKDREYKINHHQFYDDSRTTNTNNEQE